jgi:hypothetical protein
MNANNPLAAAGARSRRRLLVLSIVLAAAAGAAQADWLVLATGEEIETKGPWTLEGPKIIFTTTRGQLSSIRASSVNVDSSRALTTKKHEDATRVVVPTPAPKREPVLVLTDADFSGKPAAAAGAAGAAVAVPAGAESPAAAAPVVVPATDSLETRVARQMPGPPAVRITSWSARPTGEDQLSIFGTAQNVGSLVAAAITVGVKLIDSEGAQLGSTEAAVSTTALMPGAEADFEARFNGDLNFATVELTVDTVELEVGKPAGGAGEAAEQPTGAQPQAERPNGDQPQGDEPHSRAAGAASRPKPQAPKAKPE